MYKVILLSNGMKFPEVCRTFGYGREGSGKAVAERWVAANCQPGGFYGPGKRDADGEDGVVTFKYEHQREHDAFDEDSDDEMVLDGPYWAVVWEDEEVVNEWGRVSP